MWGRFAKTKDVIVSKIFPAGAGWQLASLVAPQVGAGSGTAFAVATGLGDALGVGLGHMAYETLRGKSWSEERPTALLLSTAAFGSGTAWQPTVDLLTTASGPEFLPVATGTGVVCASVFMVGLRLGRQVYDVPAAQLTHDAQLSASIGGATGAFVATDPALVGNLAADAMGVLETDGAALAASKAGACTAAGFAALQGTQNLLVRSAWTDP